MTDRPRHSHLVDARGGCHICHGPHGTGWTGANAMAVAARHHDANRHRTWAEQTIHVDYGGGATTGEDTQMTLTEGDAA